jgi:hypothetical protein
VERLISIRYFADAGFGDNGDTRKRAERVDAGDVEPLVVPEIMVAQKEMEAQLSFGEVPFHDFECLLVGEDIDFLPVVEQVAQENEIGDLPLLGRAKYPVKNAEAVLKAFRRLLVGVYMEVAE